MESNLARPTTLINMFDAVLSGRAAFVESCDVKGASLVEQGSPMEVVDVLGLISNGDLLFSVG